MAMMDVAGTSVIPDEIVLARAAPFVLGRLQVSPAIRQVIGPDGSETIEPRVMQVFVHLFLAGGNVVSRDDLIATCWGGRIVGEDAINRCIARIRRIAERDSPPPFSVETVARVGYRLKRLDDAPSTAPVAPPSPVRSRRYGRWIAAAFGASAVAAGGAWLWLHPATPPRWTVTRSEIIVGTPFYDRHAAISPDGTTLAYSSGPDVTVRKIFLQRLSGGSPLRLTNGAHDDFSPAWSPDGSRLAYVTYKEGEPCRLMVTQVPAGYERELGRCQTNDRTHIEWSRTGNALYFNDRSAPGNAPQIMRFDMATGKTEAVSHPPPGGNGDAEPSLSPDGRWLSFVREGGRNIRERILYDLKRDTERVMFRGSDDTGATGWSQDSQTVFTIAKDGNEYEIRANPIGAGGGYQIYPSPVALGRLASGGKNLLVAEVEAHTINLMRLPPPDGAQPQFVFRLKGSAVTPAARADGTIAMTVADTRSAGIWLLSPGGTASQLIALQDDAQSGEPRWSPDGNRIAFDTVVGDKPAIRIVNAAGANVATIKFQGTTICAPDWDRDGRAVIFPGKTAQGWQIWRAEIDHPGEVKALGYRGWKYIRTHKGVLYGMKDNEPGIWAISKTPQRITAQPAPDLPNNWTIAGDDIVYVSDAVNYTARLMAVSIAGGSPPRPVAAMPHYAGGGFTIDPRDNSVTFASYVSGDSDLQLLHLERK